MRLPQKILYLAIGYFLFQLLACCKNEQQGYYFDQLHINQAKITGTSTFDLIPNTTEPIEPQEFGVVLDFDYFLVENKPSHLGFARLTAQDCSLTFDNEKPFQNIAVKSQQIYKDSANLGQSLNPYFNFRITNGESGTMDKLVDELNASTINNANLLLPQVLLTLEEQPTVSSVHRFYIDITLQDGTMLTDSLSAVEFVL